jgi:hypothetical protein
MCNNVHAALALCHVGSFPKMKTIAVIKTGELVIVIVHVCFDSETLLVEEALCSVESCGEFQCVTVGSTVSNIVIAWYIKWCQEGRSVDPTIVMWQ